MTTMHMLDSLANLSALVQPMLRRLLALVLLASVLLAGAQSAFGQTKGKDEPPPPSKSYAMPYMIVLFFMGIGLMTVLRPGKRADSVEEKLVRSLEADE